MGSGWLRPGSAPHMRPARPILEMGLAHTPMPAAGAAPFVPALVEFVRRRQCELRLWIADSLVAEHQAALEEDFCHSRGGRRQRNRCSEMRTMMSDGEWEWCSSLPLRWLHGLLQSRQRNRSRSSLAMGRSARTAPTPRSCHGIRMRKSSCRDASVRRRVRRPKPLRRGGTLICLASLIVTAWVGRKRPTQPTCSRGDRRLEMQSRRRQRATLTDGKAPTHRRSRCHQCPEWSAASRTPQVHLRRMTTNAGGSQFVRATHQRNTVQRETAGTAIIPHGQSGAKAEQGGRHRGDGGRRRSRAP